jgi:hypothetical protein
MTDVDCDSSSSSIASGDPPTSGLNEDGNPKTPSMGEVESANQDVDYYEEEQAAENQVELQAQSHALRKQQKAQAAATELQRLIAEGVQQALGIQRQAGQANQPEIQEPYPLVCVPPSNEVFTKERMLEVRAGKGKRGKGKGGKGAADVFFLQAASDHRHAFFFNGGWPTKDRKSYQTHVYTLARLQNGVSGIVTTTKNACGDFGTVKGCTRSSCRRYHTVELGMLMDRLPAAPEGPPVLVGKLPEGARSHWYFQSQNGNLLTWSKDVLVKYEAANLYRVKQGQKAVRKLDEAMATRDANDALVDSLDVATMANQQALLLRDQRRSGSWQAPSPSLPAPPAARLQHIPIAAHLPIAAPSLRPDRQALAEAMEDAEEADLELEAAAIRLETVNAKLKAVQARKRARLLTEAEAKGC